MRMIEDCGPYPDSDTARIAKLEAEVAKQRQIIKYMTKVITNLAYKIPDAYSLEDQLRHLKEITV